MVRLNGVREKGQVCIITAHRQEMTEVFTLAHGENGEGYTVYSPMRGKELTYSRVQAANKL